MVPSGWEHRLFKQILKLDRGSSPRPIVNFVTDSDDGVNWIKIGDTKGEAAFINTTKEKITKEGAKKSRKVSKGEIILSNSMSYGKPYILNIDGFIHDGWFVIRNYEQNLERDYLIQLLGGELVQRQYKRLAAGGVVTNISSELVYFVKVDIPPLAEQRKIAKILGTWDKAISTTERLIDNSKQQKKALMQQLLTGKKRLLDDSGKPFEGEWEDKLLPDISWFQEGPGLRKWQFTDSGVKAINITNITNGILDLSKTDRHITEKEMLAKYQHFLCDANDIVVASSGNSYCKHGVVRDIDLPLLMNTSVIRFKPLKNCSYGFLNQFLKSSNFKNQIDILITGGAQPNFGPVHLKRINLKVPSVAEQTKIAVVLINADQEIELLKKQLTDLKQEKKALMQQLLTGKRRVKIDEAEVA